jgi:hypothetical protein
MGFLLYLDNIRIIQTSSGLQVAEFSDDVQQLFTSLKQLPPVFNAELSAVTPNPKRSIVKFKSSSAAGQFKSICQELQGMLGANAASRFQGSCVTFLSRLLLHICLQTSTSLFLRAWLL